MRTLFRSLLLTALTAAPALAQEEAPKANLLAPNLGLMAWTLIIFVLLALVLSKFAFGPITAAVIGPKANLLRMIARTTKMISVHAINP